MSAYKRLKKRVYEIVGPTGKGDTASTVFDILLCALVLASCVAVIIDLFFGVSDGLRRGLEIFEYVTVGIFVFEYIVRLWLSDLEYPECKNKLHAMWEYITSFDSLIDILSIVSVLFNEIPKEFAILRMVKLIKLVRLVKMSDYIQTSGKLEKFIKRAQVRTNEIIDKGKEGDVVSKIYDISSVVLILLSVSFILIETFPISAAAHRFIYIFEIIIACIFAAEYVLRVWTAPVDFPNMRPDKARMKYIFSFMSLIDLLSIVPVFVANLPTATGILKIFKLCKILRLVKASRYLGGIANFGHAIQKKKKQIAMSIIAITIMIMICSVLMYSFENKEQPEIFSNGFSGVMYSIQTMVDAESDIAPVTPIGQALSTLMLLLGGCMFGVPVAIIATGFEDMIAEQAGDDEQEDTEIYETLKLYDGMSETDKERFRKIIEIRDTEKTENTEKEE
ncbi:MAG: ion transporter [Clostridia bacterium]|nr:ion transporter [Clostridia bacterium]